jgi:DNA sulfur modification protein DndB
MRRGAREAYFDFVDYRKIVLDQWSIFQNVVGYGKKTDSKDKQTKWMVEVNDWRNIVAHPSSGRNLTVEELDKLTQYEKWLNAQKGDIDGDDSADSEDGEEAP